MMPGSCPRGAREGRAGQGRCRSESNGGFTLIEVLVAMVIVAIGVLGLQALGIAAARALALADRGSGYATLASDSLASAIHQLRRGEVPGQFCLDLPRAGERLTRTIDLSDARLVSVSVAVGPGADSAEGPEGYAITSSIYLPGGLTGTAQGGGCG